MPGLHWGSVAEISGTSTLGRNHRRTERVLRSAKRSECRTILGPLQALKDLTGKTTGVLDYLIVHRAKATFGIEAQIGIAQTQTALRNRAQTTPRSRDDFEHPTYHLLSRTVSLSPDH